MVRHHVISPNINHPHSPSNPPPQIHLAHNIPTTPVALDPAFFVEVDLIAPALPTAPSALSPPADPAVRPSPSTVPVDEEEEEA